MEKIKLNLTSGTSLEKALVTAFKTGNGEYIVLDNEMNGTMGLPIILVSKMENNRLIKILDQNEWGAVKETLRNIIAGNQVDYIKIGGEINADDTFFSQLTLPVASFESLKNNYKPVEDSQPEIPNPIQMNVEPTTEEVVEPEIPMPSIDPIVMNNVSVEPQSEVVSPIEPQVEVSPIVPEIPAATNQTEVQVEPATEPQVEPIPEVTETHSVPVDFTADKEAFLKACENMFDALVAKFKN